MSEADILLIAIILFSFLIPFAFYRLKKLRKQGLLQMQSKLSGETILQLDAKAIFYGQKSRGLIHSRQLGGIWALTNKAIHFKTFPYGKWSDFALTVPMDQVSSISKTNNFLSMGSNVMGGLIVVAFVNHQKQSDEIAFRFDDNDKIQIALQQLLDR